jgi:hypothetical protein
MRLIKTYLLHLYTDTERPERICGDIRPLDEDRSYSFKNIDDLVIRLRQCILKAPPAAPLENSGIPPLLGANRTKKGKGT